MAKRTNDPEGNRRRIVEAAFDLFATEGFNATPMQAVRDRAGVSSGALAHHFPSKQELGLAVICGPLANAIAGTWIAPVAEAANAWEGVRTVLDRTIAEVDRRGAVAGCPLGNLTAELANQNAEFRAGLKNVFDAWTATIADKLAARQPGGRDGNGVTALATFVVAVFSGAILMAKAERSSRPIRACLEQLRPLLK